MTRAVDARRWLPLLLPLAALGPGVASALRLDQPTGPREEPKLQCIVHSEVDAQKSKAKPRVSRPESCNAWPKRLEDYITTKKVPLQDDLWRGFRFMYPLKNRSFFELAAQPAGYEGARLRLREFALRLAAGESLEVAVLGGSMTYGEPGMETWVALLGKHLQKIGHDIQVHNLAKSSTGSEYAATHVVYDDPRIEKASLIIIDTSVNDWADWFLRKNGASSQESFDVLVEELLGLPHRPAVIDLATFHMDVHKKQVTAFAWCTDDLAEFPHSCAERFEVPLVSFPDGVCHGGRKSWWFGNLHPNGTTHDIIARTMVGVLGLEMERACAADGLEVTDHPVVTGVIQLPYANCLRQNRRLGEDFSIKNREEDGMEFISYREGGWTFARDLPTKPFGWLLPANASDGSFITFKVDTTSGGWVRLDYLSTYENIGSVTCWPGGFERAQGCRIDAILKGDFSVERSAYIGIPSGSPPTDQFTCSSNGGKFKVLGLASC